MSDYPEDVMQAAREAAAKLPRYIINYDERGEQRHDNGDFVHLSDALEYLSRAILTDRARRMKVKGLEWTEEEKWRFIGRPPEKMGDFCFWVLETNSGWKVAGKEGKYGTAREAKAAAQADYERRILAALEWTDELDPLVLEASPSAYLVHEMMVPRMPAAAVGRHEMPTEYLYPVSREQHAKELAKMMRGECVPLYAKATADEPSLEDDPDALTVAYMAGEAKGKERIAEAEAQAEKYKGLAEDGAECLLEWANLVKAKTSEIEALVDENRRLRATTKPWTSEELSALQDLLTKTAGRLAEAEADAERLAEALRFYAKNVGRCRMNHSEGDEARRALDKDCGDLAYAALSAHEARKGKS